MESLTMLETLPWCKSKWEYLSKSKDTDELLKQCSQLPKVSLTGDVEEIIKKSKEFPIAFPIQTVRLETLKTHRPVARLKNNIISTYPLIHERVLLLMAHFLAYKREFGSDIEKGLYKDMTVPQFIDRLLTKRAATFMKSDDVYKLVSGESGKGGWESVGTPQEQPPLVLENVLSYDEIKISAMLYVSGKTECINNGTRRNAGVVNETNTEENAVIIGIIGSRFKRKDRMDWEETVITEKQNTAENGFGAVTPSNKKGTSQEAKRKWREMWAEFFEVPNHTFKELISTVTLEDKDKSSQYTDRYVKIPRSKDVFDNAVYYKKVYIIAETCLLEAEARGKEEGRDVFLNVIGAGLGVWMISSHQVDVYILTFLDRIRAFLKEGRLDHVTDINFAYIKPSSTVSALFTEKVPPKGKTVQQKLFLESKSHPKGGINLRLENREPSSKLTGADAGKLLVMTYAWDGNAQPGNEFWIGKLSSSGDSAAASCTQVSELHNSYINPGVTACNTRVAGRKGIHTLQEYCSEF